MMINRKACARLLGAALAAALLARAEPAHAQRLQGRVIDTSTQAPVSAAALQLVGADSTVAKYGVTDEAGGFTLEADRAGEYTLKIAALGYQSAALGPLPLERGETLEITVALGPQKSPIDTASTRARSSGARRR